MPGRYEPEAICANLLERYPHCRVVLTLGSDGVIYRDAAVSAGHGMYDVPVVDSTGAGDTFMGFFLTSVLDGDSVAHALEFASKASSIAVSRMGSCDAIPLKEEVLAANIKLAEKHREP